MIRNVIKVLALTILGSAGSAEIVFGTAASLAPAAEPVAELVIRATLPDGSPAVGVPVHEFGIERYTIYNAEVGRTDSEGRYRIGFQKGLRPDKSAPLGYGVYRYILKPVDLRWEVSDIYCWNEYSDDKNDARYSMGRGGFSGYASWFEADYDGAPEAKDPANNWSYGKGVPMREGDQQDWQVQLQWGSSLDVSVVDQFGKPIIDRDIIVYVDLHAHSHTGFGAELLQRTVRVDEHGRFRLDKVGDYAYQFYVQGGGLYVPDNSVYDPRLFQNIAIQGTTLRYQRTVPQDVKFVVEDGVTGKPIRGAQLYDAISFPSQTQSGLPLEGKTDAEGKLDCSKPIALEHVAWFDAKAEGYEDGRFYMKNYVEGEPIAFKLIPTK